MIRSVWLDLDNTLLDFDAYAKQAMREGFARFGFYYEPWMFAVFQEETNAFKNETRKCTFAELTRLKHAYGDEEDNIDVLRLRWWPHGYILVLIFEILFCSDLLLILKLMGKL